MRRPAASSPRPRRRCPSSSAASRNWDYRFCWLRDATLDAAGADVGRLLSRRHRLARMAAARRGRQPRADPDHVRPCRASGSLAEWELPWLPGYQGSRPVRVGNAAADQLQLDVYGELIDALHCRRRSIALAPVPAAGRLQRTLIEHLERDLGRSRTRASGRCAAGGGTSRTPRSWLGSPSTARFATLSDFARGAPLERWRELRDRIHAEFCRRASTRAATPSRRASAATELDASLLLIPLVGFLPPDDPRVLGTVAAIERELMVDGFVLRYRTEAGVDGLPPGEGAFLPCSFWLADNYALQDRDAEADALFERLLVACATTSACSRRNTIRARTAGRQLPAGLLASCLDQTALNLHDIGPAQRRGQGAKHGSKGDARSAGRYRAADRL